MFADVPLAIHSLREKKLVRRAMIVDTDIHQENGFASYYVDDKDTAIFDIYERDNYPARKWPETYAHPIPFGTTEAEYLGMLRTELPKALDDFRPDVLFYIAGVDPLAGDRLGHAQLSADGLVDRDLFVIRQARQRNIPTVVTLAGGYHRDGWRATYRVVRALLRGQ
jgi:acetoin utilization deacetylase AcuC-like enzyme